MSKPNFLIVMVDQLSGTFFPGGGPADFLHAPHLKALASRSARFANAHTPWDYQPLQNASERFMRNHMNLDTLEGSKRFPRGE